MDGARGAREKNLTFSRNVRVQPCTRADQAAIARNRQADEPKSQSRQASEKQAEINRRQEETDVGRRPPSLERSHDQVLGGDIG